MVRKGFATTHVRSRALPWAVAVVTVIASSCAVVVDAGAASVYSPPAPRPAMISAGLFHTLAVTPSGTVRAWGFNANGELGDGATGASTTPVSVLGYTGSAPLTHVVEVAAGSYSSYALLSDGTVAAWGDNAFGQLGDGGTVSSSRPVRVVSTSGSGALSGVVGIAAGAHTALALLANHTVVAWGDGDAGELGNGQAGTYSDTPVAVTGLTGVVAIAAGSTAAYAVTSAGTVESWGSGAYGALGDNDTGNQSRTVHVAGVGAVGRLTDVVGVAAGNSWATALLTDGTVVSWGRDDSGQLGVNSTANSTVPVPVRALGDRIASIGAGNASSSAFAVNANGAVFAWGADGESALGDGSLTDKYLPVRVATLGAGSGVAQIDAGSAHSVAVTGAGTTYVWGDNAHDQFGDGSSVGASTPTQPYGLGKVGLPALYLRTAPALGGHAQVGGTLTVTAGTWGLPAITHTYQWLRDGKAVAGATSSRYRATSADRGHRVAVRVTAGRPGYPSTSTTTRSVAIR